MHYAIVHPIVMLSVSAIALAVWFQFSWNWQSTHVLFGVNNMLHVNHFTWTLVKDLLYTNKCRCNYNLKYTCCYLPLFMTHCSLKRTLPPEGAFGRSVSISSSWCNAMIFLFIILQPNHYVKQNTQEINSGKERFCQQELNPQSSIRDREPLPE